MQAAQLSLSTAPGRVDAVAQEVFDVVGRQRGVVSSSSVTAGGTGGYAQFQLSLPSASLGQTMASLSTLPYARVASRTDTTQDVNDQYLADARRLADARALRTSLLKQLANATTQAQIDSLTARIHDGEIKGEALEALSGQVLPRLRAVMGSKAAGQYFPEDLLLAATLDDERIGRASALLRSTSSGRERAVLLEALEAVLPAEEAGRVLPLLDRERPRQLAGPQLRGPQGRGRGLRLRRR